METRQFLLNALARLEYEVELVMDSLSPEDLRYQPKPDSNSIGWLIWHTARSQDRLNADLLAEDQLWVSGKWHEKFGRTPDQKDTGLGHTSAQVAAFRVPDCATLLAYYRAVAARTRDYINTHLTAAELDREVYSPTLERTNAVYQRLISAIYNFEHVGQAGFIKGLLKGKGWYIA